MSLSKAKAIPYLDMLGRMDGDGTYHWARDSSSDTRTYFDDIRYNKDDFPPERAPIFHFALAAHLIDATGISGASKVDAAGGSDFVLSLGCFSSSKPPLVPALCDGVGNTVQQAGSLMHELGHNLGLRHGGGDDINFKPNYLSVMNYDFQTRGIFKDGSFGTIDYSERALPTLQKDDLNEAAGLGTDASGYGTLQYCSNLLDFLGLDLDHGYVLVRNADQAIDWDCDKDKTETHALANIDHNFVDSRFDSFQTLAGFDDWRYLEVRGLKGGAIGLFGVSALLPTQTTVVELTAQEDQQIAPIDPGALPLPIPQLSLAAPGGSQPWGTQRTLTASLTNVSSPSGTPITFTVTGANPQMSVVSADTRGNASFTYAGTRAGMDVIVATATVGGSKVASVQPTAVWAKHTTTLNDAPTAMGDYDDPTVLTATLLDASVSADDPVQGAAVTLGVGSQNCTATTDSSGQGTCGVTPNGAAGSYALTATFDGDSQYLGSSATPGVFTVNKEETVLAITPSPTLAVGNVVVSAVLEEDGQVRISGRTVTFAAGGATATGTTDADGVASASLALDPGKYSLAASFASDAYYVAASVTSQTLYVYQPTQFVIWGGNPPIPSGQLANVAVGQDYVFWGAQWAKQVTGGDFQANSSFKGYADQVSGATWTAKPGNASSPPSGVASYIGVIVATQATKQGGTISGNVAAPVVLQVDNPAAYQPDPGHPGSGLLVAIVQ